MSRIFLSHSSKDNASAIALRDWLVECGWDDLFLDVDPERGIVAGERWERALYEAANRCEAVVFLFSKAWLASPWCLRELNLARKLNKRIFGVIVDDTTKAELPAEVSGTWQLVSLATGTDHQLFRVQLPGSGEAAQVTFSRQGLARLRAGLSRAGLDPGFFAWPPASDPQRPPYRGLRPLEAEDAGIFFGREAAIIETLDRLRGLREAAPPRWLAILGASGAGKSSFLRAGLLPRLTRDDRNFLTLPVVRPERAALSGETGLIRGLETALQQAGLGRSRAAIRAAVEAGANEVRPLLEALVERARPPSSSDEAAPSPPALVLALDQGEELFLAEGAAEGQALLTLLRELSEAPSPTLIVLVTIRTDAYEQLQTAQALEGLTPAIQSLPPLPRGAYQTVIEGPAQRLAQSQRPLRIEPALTRQLLADLEAGGAKDALPLLAFTLERLYVDYGGDGDLSLDEYHALGGIRGSLEAAVERAMEAADTDPSVPRDRDARLALLRRGLIPWLAGIDPVSGAPRRRVARFSEIPIEARPLVNHLVEARLLAMDVTPEGERTIEPAHEALLRQWGLLQGWLEEDFAALTTLESVQRAARDWSANDKTPDWLAHRGGRLEDAERLRERSDLAEMLGSEEWAYLTECRVLESQQRDKELEDARRIAESQRQLAEAQRRELDDAQRIAESQRELAESQRRTVQRTRYGLMAAIALATVALVTTVIGSNRQRTAVHNESVSLAALSQLATAQGSPADGLKLALAAWPRVGDTARPQLRNTISSLADALGQLEVPSKLLWHESAVLDGAFTFDGTRIVTVSIDGKAYLWDAQSGKALATLREQHDKIRHPDFSPDGMRVLTSSEDGTGELWDAQSGEILVTLQGLSRGDCTGVFSSDGTLLVTVFEDGTAQLWDAQSGKALVTLQGDGHTIESVDFSPDGTNVVTAETYGTARIWDVRTGAELAVLRDNLWGRIHSYDGDRILMSSNYGDVVIREWRAGRRVVVLGKRVESDWGADGIGDVAPDWKFVVTAPRLTTYGFMGSPANFAHLRDAHTGAELATFRGHESEIESVAFSRDGTRILTTSQDSTRLWDARARGDARVRAEIAVWRGKEKGIVSASFSPDSVLVVTTFNEGTAVLSDARTGATLVTLKGHHKTIRRVAFSPDGTRVMTVSADGTARVWDIHGEVPRTWRAHANMLKAAALSPDGMRVLTTSSDRTTRIWDANSGAELVILQHLSLSRVAAFSPDSTRAVTVSDDGTAHIWDARSGAILATSQNLGDRVNSAAFSPDGSLVVTTFHEGTAVLLDARSGATLVTLRGLIRAIDRVAFSPDSMRIVAASSDGMARVWDARSGATLVTLQDHERAINSAAFAPDGMRVVTASSDGTARIWDANSGAELTSLRGHDRSVYTAAFSPDGMRVVTVSADSTVRIWDVASGAELTTLRSHIERNVKSAVFLLDGTRVMTAGFGGVVLWDAASGAQLAAWIGEYGSVSADFTRVLVWWQGRPSFQGSRPGKTDPAWDHENDQPAISVFSLTRFEQGDAFEIACDRLGSDTYMTFADRWGFKGLKPICGKHSPSPIDWQKVR